MFDKSEASFQKMNAIKHTKFEKKEKIQSPQGKEDAAATLISTSEEKDKFSKFKETRPELNLSKI